jgi:hypothetical protein
MPGNPPGYSASYAERERLHLRQETYFGRRTSQSSLVPAILEPVKRLVSKARLKWDTAPSRGQAVAMGAGQVANGLRCSGATYSACECMVLLGFWLDVFRKPSNGDHRYVTASVLARRALRGWRCWTIQEKLLAPTWQQVRLNARLLPPLPTPTGGPTRQPARLVRGLGPPHHGRTRWAHAQRTTTVHPRG